MRIFGLRIGVDGADEFTSSSCRFWRLFRYQRPSSSLTWAHLHQRGSRFLNRPVKLNTIKKMSQ